MKDNKSLQLSFNINQFLNQDLSSLFFDFFPFDEIKTIKDPKSRDRVFNLENTILTMILTMTEDDKSLENAVTIYRNYHNRNQLRLKELIINSSKQKSNSFGKVGRPKKLLPFIPKSKLNDISSDTSGFSQARQRTKLEAFDLVFKASREIKDTKMHKTWYGRRVFLTDGTYLQLQDSPQLNKAYPKRNGDTFPQVLLQVLTEQNSGLIHDFRLSSHNQSELFLFSQMIENIPSNSLLLADDLYNTFAIFALLRNKNIDIITPGKRKRNYKVLSVLGIGDEIVELTKSSSSITGIDKDLDIKTLQMRRITYKNIENEEQQLVIYTSILDSKISKEEIIMKYTDRWDVEVSIREIKTIMDINIVRSKTVEMIYKEVCSALVAYNYIRQIILLSTFKSDFSPKRDIFYEFYQGDSELYVDKLGRKYTNWSKGRNRRIE